MPTICLKCGGTQIVEQIARRRELDSEGDIVQYDDIVECYCEKCYSSFELVEFSIGKNYKKEVGIKLTKSDEPLIEFGRLILEDKIFLYPDDLNKLINKLTSDNRVFVKKIGMFLKLKSRWLR